MNFTTYLRKSLITIIIFVLLVVLVVVNLFIKSFFNTYLSQRTMTNDQAVIETILSLSDSGSLNYSNLEALSITNSAYIMVYSGDDIIFETNNQTSLFNYGNTGGRGMMGRMQTFSTLDKSSLTFNAYPITNDVKITQIEIGRTMEIISNSDEGKFVFAINAVVFIAFFAALLLIWLMARTVSKRFSKPINHLSRQIEQISKKETVTPIDPETFEEFENLSHTLIELNDNLNHQEALRKRLTSDLAHELKNPLAILSSHIEAFTDGVWEPTQEKLNRCDHEIKRLTTLINELSDLTAIEGNMSLKKSKINLSNLVEDNVSQYEMVLSERKLKLVSHIEENIFMTLDSKRFTQVLINLVTNAIKYAKDEGQIIVSLTTIQNKVYLKVSDDGIGISKDDLPYIFERFYRADTLRSKTTGGLGIGLSIVKAICEAHGFKISVESQLDQGTTFTVEMSLRP